MTKSIPNVLRVVKGYSPLFLYPLRGDFKVGDRVIDLTARENRWPDDLGVVIEIDGSHVKVRYESGNERWKAHINLRHDDKQFFQDETKVKVEK